MSDQAQESKKFYLTWFKSFKWSRLTFIKSIELSVFQIELSVFQIELSVFQIELSVFQI